MTYLLDANACIEHLRSRGTSRVSQRLEALPPSEFGMSSIVRAELLFGVYISAQRTKNLAVTLDLIDGFQPLSFDERAAEIYADIASLLEKRGQRMGTMDAMIAATAIANSLTLVTHDVADFSNVPNLRIEDWQTS